jgi:hypothetical protein
MERHVPLKTQLSDTARLLLTALVVVLVFMLVVVLSVALVPHQYTERIQGKWVRFGIVSIGFWGYTLKAYWKLRKSPNFWAILLGFLVIHLFGAGYFFYVGRGLSLLVFGPVCGVEFGCMALIIYWCLGVGPDKVNLNV